MAAPNNIKSIVQKISGDSSSVEISLIGEVDVHAFREDRDYVVDIGFEKAQKSSINLPAKATPAVAAKNVIGTQSKPPTSESIAKEAKVAIAPQGDEIVLPKTSSSLFNSTNFDYLLRNIGIEDVFVTGFLTDQCVDHTVRDGADRGYCMTCVHDACTAETKARHEAALEGFRGYCRMLSTDEALNLVTSAQ